MNRRRAMALVARGALGALGARSVTNVLRASSAAASATIPILGGCRGRARGEDDGRLVVYAAAPRSLAEAMIASYAERSAVRVDLFSATTGQILAKVEAERFNPRADVLILASGLAAEWLRREGRLASFDWPAPEWAGREDRAGWFDPHGAYVATGAACVGIAARSDWRHGTTSWTSMLDGGFVNDEGAPGLVVMPSPSRSGSSGDFVVQWTLEEGERAWRLMIDARRRGILEVRGANSEALGSLRGNTSQAILAAVDYQVCDAIARGDPITLTLPASGVPIVTRPACILKSTRRPAAAQAFVASLLSEPIQQLVAAANLIPADPAIPLSPARAAAGVPKPMPLDVDRALADQREILRRFQYEVERLVVTG